VISTSFFLKGKAPKKIQAIINKLRQHVPSYATVKSRVVQFKPGNFSTCDAHRSGRPKTVIIQENIGPFHELILEDRRPDFV
jgi:hypothetical protein